MLTIKQETYSVTNGKITIVKTVTVYESEDAQKAEANFIDRVRTLKLYHHYDERMLEGVVLCTPNKNVRYSRFGNFLS